MKLKLSELRKMIEEERKRILLEVDHEDRASELQELGQGKGGQRVARAGNQVIQAADVIDQVAGEHTGQIRQALHETARFVEKIGTALTSMGGRNMGESDMPPSHQLPTVSELKLLTKRIGKLEK